MSSDSDEYHSSDEEVSSVLFLLTLLKYTAVKSSYLTFNFSRYSCEKL